MALPVNYAAGQLAGAAARWFKRIRKTDDLSRLIKTAAGSSAELNDREFNALRNLLAKEGTWALLAGGELRIPDLTEPIAECLPAREGRTPAQSREAASAIARGLLEFAVFDLDPAIFQRVALARLQQMVDHASALDVALYEMHGDLYARLDSVTDLLRRVADRLPPGPAGLADVMIYLTTLIDWLNTDEWPRRLGEPSLTPAKIERKLRITADGNKGHESDADDLAGRCTRLVVLGGPGSGKTWLARRQVRLCAEAARDALANSAIADVELPLYTTCAALRDASGEGIRHHVVTSALSLLPDLGGTRIMASLRELFNNRNGQTLLVADSLDEAPGVDSRISNLDTLPPAWRIMLTTRPGAWTRQLAVNEADPLQRTGVLQPLRFPSDVERFVTAWFSGRPDQAAALNGQLRDRPALQPAATVPLILAFFCVLGGEAPLPGRRSDLYAKVIRRMLTGSWRTSGNQNLDVAACEAILRKWAWSTVAADRVSGIGRWKDEFLTAHVKGKKIRDALTHIAVPLGGPPYPEPGTVRRRFVHRSIQEHLVAEHVRDHLPAKETAAELLKHIWFDVDWEHAAPAALARHPKHNRILKDILRRITGDSHSGAALAAVDGSWEIRRFLARVAQESSEDDWAPELAELIGQARVDLVSSGPSALKEIIAPEWPTSNQLVAPALVRLVTAYRDPEDTLQVPSVLAILAVTAQDRARARRKLLSGLADGRIHLWYPGFLEATEAVAVTPQERSDVREVIVGLPGFSRGQNVRDLARIVARFAVSAEEQREFRELLLGLLARQDDAFTAAELTRRLSSLDPPESERAHARETLLKLLARESYPNQSEALAKGVAALAVTAQERRFSREALTGELSRRGYGRTAQLARVTVAVADTAEERQQVRGALASLLAATDDARQALDLAREISRLDPSPQDLERGRSVLLRLLGSERDSGVAAQLACTAAGFALSSFDRAQARRALIELLGAEERAGWILELVRAIRQLDPPPVDRVEACKCLIRRLAAKRELRPATDIACAAASLASTPPEQQSVREALLGLLPSRDNPGPPPLAIAQAIASLDPPPETRIRLGEALVGAIAAEEDPREALKLARTVAEMGPDDLRSALIRRLAAGIRSVHAAQVAHVIAELGPSAGERDQVRAALLNLLAAEDNDYVTAALTRAAISLATEPERISLRKALVGLFTGSPDPDRAVALARAIAGLDPPEQERKMMRDTLLGLLAAGDTGRWDTGVLAREVTALAVTPDERARARDALLALLTVGGHPRVAAAVADVACTLNPPAAERGQAREALLSLLATEDDESRARQLAPAIAKLAPTTTERDQARAGLLALLAREGRDGHAWALARTIAELRPTAAELDRSGSWPFPPCQTWPTWGLLTPARRNSDLRAWLKTLPHLGSS